MTTITEQDVDAVCALVNDLCGIFWDESKSYLIQSRLSHLAQQHECANYTDLVRKVRAGLKPSLKEHFIDAVTTNETLWFRDSSPFQALRYKILPELIDAKANTAFARRLRIWSAACSTGQEAYSIAISIAETIPDYNQWDIQIVGTDISSAAVAHASHGVYDALQIKRGLDAPQRTKYFTEQDKTWKVNDQIRAMCTFAQRNLHDAFNDMGPFDVIFCRNVAIYFTEEDRRSLFERAADRLVPNGWIVVGSSESLSSLGPRWRPQQHCHANCYRPNDCLATTSA